MLRLSVAHILVSDHSSRFCIDLEHPSQQNRVHLVLPRRATQVKSQEDLRGLQGHHLPVPGDSQRAQRDGSRRHDASGRAQDRPGPVVEPAQKSAHQRRPELEIVVLSRAKDESHLPHDEHVQLGSQPKVLDRRMLGSRQRAHPHQACSRQGNCKWKHLHLSQAFLQVMLNRSLFPADRSSVAAIFSRS